MLCHSSDAYGLSIYGKDSTGLPTVWRQQKLLTTWDSFRPRNTRHGQTSYSEWMSADMRKMPAWVLATPVSSISEQE